VDSRADLGILTARGEQRIHILISLSIIQDKGNLGKGFGDLLDAPELIENFYPYKTFPVCLFKPSLVD
jgi:hypothetical protein